jgi:hypothetical protein
MNKSNRIAILSGLTAAMLLAGLDQTVVATALPQIDIRKDEHSPLEQTVLKLDEEFGQSDKLHQPKHE